MLKPTRTVLTLVAGSLVLGLTGVGAAVADEGPKSHKTSHQNTARDDSDGRDSDRYEKDRDARGVVISNSALTVRSKPSTRSRSLGKVHPHQKLVLECKVRGERVDGNSIWYLLETRKDNDGKGNDGRENGNGGREDGNGGREDGNGGREDGNGGRENGENGNGGRDERDDLDGSDGLDRVALRKVDKERKEYWVSARYVKNLSPVEWCRL